MAHTAAAASHVCSLGVKQHGALFCVCNCFSNCIFAACRQLSTGDQLRVFYENLSKDPNSLANLDQVRLLTCLLSFCTSV